MMFNLETREWDDDLLGRLQHPEADARRDRPVGHDRRRHRRRPSARTSRSRRTSATSRPGLFGQAAFAPGQSKMTYGTAGVLNINCGEQPQRVAGLTPSMALGGAGHRRVRDRGRPVRRWARRCSGCATTSSSSTPPPTRSGTPARCPARTGVYLVPAFTGLSAPDWDPYARAAIIGISNATTRLHIIRAAVESMVYQTRDVVEAAVHGGAPHRHPRAAGRRRRGEEQLPLPAAGRHARHPGGAAEDRRGDRLRHHAHGGAVDRDLQRACPRSPACGRRTGGSSRR